VQYWYDQDSIWSPDSKRIAYTPLEADGSTRTVRVADAATGTSREILNSRDLGAPDYIPGLVAWSPSGEQLTFLLVGPEPQASPSTWLGLVNADSSSLEWLSQENGLIIRHGFSADGQYLAAARYDSGQQSVQDGQLVIYSVLGHSRLATLEHTWNFTWSPTGHQLAVIGSSGVDLIPDIGSPQRQNLATDSCTEVRWNPGKTSR
jgi:Tol biopolymer transport system component